MVHYLLKHTVSVLVTVGVLVVVGVWALLRMPVSLLPDIPIPEIRVVIKGGTLSAAEMERERVQPLRQQLTGVAHLNDLHSVAQSEEGLLVLTFEYGTDMDLAFIEVNERVDRAMSHWPQGASRPIVSKIGVGDIPIQTYALLPKHSGEGAAAATVWGDLCDIVRQIVRPRLEQLPEVTEVVAKGMVDRQWRVHIDAEKLAAMGGDEQMVIRAFQENQVDAAPLTLGRGPLAYTVQFHAPLYQIHDLLDLPLTQGSRLFRLRDIATVEEEVKEQDVAYYNGRRAVVLEVIKHPKARMERYQTAMQQALQTWQAQYPQYEYHLVNDSSHLLEVTVSSLLQNLLLALLLVVLLSFLFFRNMRLPGIVAVSMLISLAISAGVLYIFGLSLNLISLFGWIIAVGLMVDNSLIVTDDITQYRLVGHPLYEACRKGTEEVVSPMLSSALTTIVVFLPLLSLGGLPGALFHDQAYALSLALLVSLVIAVGVTPVLYAVMAKKMPHHRRWEKHLLLRWYERGEEVAFRHSRWVRWLPVGAIPLCVLLFMEMEKAVLPTLPHSDLRVQIEWGEDLGAEENRWRTLALRDELHDLAQEDLTYVGTAAEDIREPVPDGSASQLYIRLRKEVTLDEVRRRCEQWKRQFYPQAMMEVQPPLSVVEAVLPTQQDGLRLEAYPRGAAEKVAEEQVAVLDSLLHRTLGSSVRGPRFQERIQIFGAEARLSLYGISRDELREALQSAVGAPAAYRLSGDESGWPLTFQSRQEGPIDSVLQTALWQRPSGTIWPLHYFIRVETSREVARVEASTRGRFIPFDLGTVTKETAEAGVRFWGERLPHFDYVLTGSPYQNRAMMHTLFLLLLLSVILMYLILTAQFESFVLPLIVLAEIPIDIAVALLCLMAFGQTLNVMSAIGIVVSCGIIVNDSIHKLNVVRRLRREGCDVMTAIRRAGRWRLRAIVMTSLTSILVFLPVFFSHDIGSEMQRPFAIAMCAAMVVGTWVSLFAVPVWYYFVDKRFSCGRQGNNSSTGGASKD